MKKKFTDTNESFGVFFEKKKSVSLSFLTISCSFRVQNANLDGAHWSVLEAYISIYSTSQTWIPKEQKRTLIPDS